MNVKELRNKNEQELTENLKKIKTELKDVSASTLQGKEKNVKKAGLLRRQVARLMTLIGEKKFLVNEETK